MARLQLTLFGGFRGRVEGMSLTVPTRKAQALLAFLALPPGRPYPREKLASLLWGGMREAQARAGLRQALFTLRKAVVTEPPTFQMAGESVAMNPAAVGVDVVEFERSVAEGTPEALERAASLYGGDLLEGLALQEGPFEEWLTAERERLRELALEALAKLLREQRRAGATEAALQTALRLLALDPLQEAVHRALMRLYVERGRRSAALRQYQLCVGVLQRELRIEPEATTKQLYQEILRQRPSPAASTIESADSAFAGPAPDAAGRADDTLPREHVLVGREAEMARLRESLGDAWAGRGRVVGVIGEAGVGKTRLVAEIAAEAAGRGARVLLGRCYEAEQLLPFASWVDAFRAGHVGGDGQVLRSPGALWRTELARLLPELAPPGQEPPPGPVDYRQLFESVAQLLRLLIRQHPVVLILEDLHWGDEMSLRLLSFVGRRLATWPILVVATAREEEMAGAPILRRTLDDLSRDQGLVEVRLPPLGKPDTLTLVRNLAGQESGDAGLAQLGEQVWIVSEGNPFAAVETVRMLRSGNAEPSAKLAVPKRVRDVIERHLDALTERGRELTTVAAVIGREFEFPLLWRAAGIDESEAATALEELVRRRVLHNLGERFDFTHDRIREVAYGRLLRERQRALHARIAQSMETLYADRLGEHVERLSHHAARGALAEKAVAYLGQAGAKAFANCAHTEALAYFTEALDLLGTLRPGAGRDGEELALRLALGPTLQAARGYAAPAVEENYGRARQLANEVGAPVQRFQALWGTWLVASHRASAAVALDLGQELLALAERLDDASLRLEGHHALWPVLVWLGKADAARGHLDRGMALYDKAQHRSHAFTYGGHDPGVCCRKVASWASWLLGYPARGLEESRASITLAEELAHPTSMVVALVWACVFRDLRRDVLAVQEYARALIALATEYEASQWIAAGTIIEGAVHAELGEGATAIAQIERGLAAYRSTGAQLFLPYFLSLLARARLKTGEPSDGLRVVREALERVHATDERVWEPELVRLEGELRLAASPADVSDAEGCFRHAIEIARRQSARSWELRAAVSLARVLLATGRRVEAHRTVAGIYEWFTEGFDTADLKDARALLETLTTSSTLA